MDEGILYVVVDLPCVGCGYNLRMQKEVAVCPECGLEIRQTINDTALRWGRAYLRRISRSVFFAALFSMAMPLEFFAATIAINFLIRYLIGGPGVPSMDYYQYVIWARFGNCLLFGLLALGHAIAMWLATSAPREKRISKRTWLIRIGIVMFLLATVLMVLMSLDRILEAGDSGSAIIHTILSFDRFIEYAMFAFPILAAGVSLAASESSVRIQEIERHAGFVHNRLIQWSLGMFSWGFILLMFIGFLMLIIDKFLNSFIRISDVEYYATILGLGAGGVSAIGLILSMIALLKFSGRMEALAKFAPEVGASFTGELPQMLGDVAHNDVTG